MVEDVHDYGRPQGRISDTSRLDVAEDVTSAAQEHDAVSRWIRFVPFQFVVRDLDLGPDVDMRTMPRLVRPIVGDLGVRPVPDAHGTQSTCDDGAVDPIAISDHVTG